MYCRTIGELTGPMVKPIYEKKKEMEINLKRIEEDSDYSEEEKPDIMKPY